MNQHLLVSDAEHLRVEHEINPYMNVDDQPEPRRRGRRALGDHGHAPRGGPHP